MLSQLHVITPLFNPWRYRTRGEHYQRFRKHVRDTGMCKLYVGELAFGARPFEFTQGHDLPVDGGETWEYQFRTRHELWHKERMINRLVQELPSDWEYMAWIDADLNFVRDDWALETVHRLQHYDVVQMFSHCQNLDNEFGVHKLKPPRVGFVYAWENGITPPGCNYYSAFQFGHPGFAWAIRRDAYEKLGGLIDISVLGSGDYHMALALVGMLEDRLPAGISAGYQEQLLLWQQRAERYIQHDIGHVPGLVNHYWHGARKDRRYNERWKILEDHKYDPEFDLKFDAQGLYQWTDRCPQMHYDIRRYFANRREDDPRES